MLVDSHCHLDYLAIDAEAGGLAAVLDRAAAVGVGHFLSAGVDLRRWPALRELVEPFPQVVVSVGVHPSDAPEETPTVAGLCRLADDVRVVALGETGLDYYYGRDSADRQRENFRVHCRAARETGKPLIVHTRDAREDTLSILAEEGAADVGGVLHCFTEDWDMAQRALDLNFHVSFSGIVTFRSARQIQDVARRLPLERMLVETDSPYLAPVPHRGKPNQPAWVREVAQFIADLREVPLTVIAEATSANYFRLFPGAAGGRQG